MHGTRIHLFGASGSGTTTLGQAVAKRTRMPFFDVDSYYWKQTDPPFAEKRPIDERVAALEQDIDDARGWVLSGSMCGWGDLLIPRFSLAVFIHLDPTVRMQRLSNRERGRYGDRIGPGGDMQNIHREFMEWAVQYDSAELDMRSFKLHQEWIRALPCPVLRLDSNNSLDVLTDKVITGINR